MSFFVFYSGATVVLTIIYILLMLFYLLGWLLTPEFSSAKRSFSTKVSIIVPARNEAANIGDCIGDLLKQDYPPHLFEILIIDDFSEDNTCEVVKTFQGAHLKLLCLKDYVQSDDQKIAYKKKAIETGIKAATGDLIITTDADCRMGSEWLSSIIKFYEAKKSRMIVSPVLFFEKGNLFSQFQALDYLGMIAIGAGTLHFNFPTLCNGANLAYEKKAFDAVNGFTNIDATASGDDMLLMQKIAKKFPGEIAYLKSQNAAVFTYTNETLNRFYQQRLRWTSKSKYYNDWKIRINLVLVYLFNLSILITAVFSIFDSGYLPLLLFQIVLKMIADFALLSDACKFFHRQRLIFIFIPSQLMHIFYVITIGFLGNILKPVWKERNIR